MELNLKFYKGEDLYSDGDIENILLDYTSKYEDGHYDEVFKQDLRWPVFYHLSKIRQNIINWYPIEKDAEVLEIGAGLRSYYWCYLRKSR